MSEERGEKAEGRILLRGALFICSIAVIATGVTCLMFLAISGMPPNTETKTLTILHAWEEGGQYYFADELGCVYHIACKGNLWKQEGELRYDDMPKVRFEKLEEGQRYNVEYVVRQGNVRLSLSEEEMVR